MFILSIFFVLVIIIILVVLIIFVIFFFALLLYFLLLIELSQVVQVGQLPPYAQLTHGDSYAVQVILRETVTRYERQIISGVDKLPDVLANSKMSQPFPKLWDRRIY